MNDDERRANMIFDRLHDLRAFLIHAYGSDTPIKSIVLDRSIKKQLVHDIFTYKGRYSTDSNFGYDIHLDEIRIFGIKLISEDK